MDIGIEDALLDHCLNHYGRDKQVIKTIEEMSELTKELCKDLVTSGASGNIASIHEELADTVLMVCQLIRIYGLAAEMTETEKKIEEERKKVEAFDKKFEGEE